MWTSIRCSISASIFRLFVGLFMKTYRLPILVLSTLAPLALSACGEGYEAVPYHGVPYTEERTAGAGVQYVRAMMLPEKGPVLAPVVPQTVVPVQETVIKDAAPLFGTGQLKK